MDLFEKKTEGKLRVIIFPRCSPAWTVIPLFMRDFQCPFYSRKVFFIYLFPPWGAKTLKKKKSQGIAQSKQTLPFFKGGA